MAPVFAMNAMNRDNPFGVIENAATGERDSATAAGVQRALRDLLGE